MFWTIQMSILCWKSCRRLSPNSIRSGSKLTSRRLRLGRIKLKNFNSRRWLLLVLWLAMKRSNLLIKWWWLERSAILTAISSMGNKVYKFLQRTILTKLLTSLFKMKPKTTQILVIRILWCQRNGRSSIRNKRVSSDRFLQSTLLALKLSSSTNLHFWKQACFNLQAQWMSVVP